MEIAGYILALNPNTNDASRLGCNGDLGLRQPDFLEHLCLRKAGLTHIRGRLGGYGIIFGG